MTYINKHSVIAIGILFPLLGLISVALRIYVRRSRKTKLGFDDWLCIPSLVLVTGHGAIMITGGVKNAIGNHSPVQTAGEFIVADPPNQVLLGKVETAFDMIHPATLACLKLTIIWFYRRILRGKTFNIFSWILSSLIVIWAAVIIILIGTACGSHFNANWKSIGILKEECFDTFKLFVAYTVTDVAVDLTILILPMPTIFNLQMPMRRRVAVCGVLLVGGLATACGIARMAFFVNILAPGLNKDINSRPMFDGVASTDDLGVVSLLIFWGMMEVGIGIIAICLPTLLPLFKNISLESVVNSIRSALSLQSLASVGSGRGRRQENLHQKDPMSSETNIITSEPVPFNYAEGSTQNAYVMGPLKTSQSRDDPAEGTIRVECKVRQDVEDVP